MPSSFGRHIIFCSQWLRLCGGPFALVGFYLSWPPFFACLLFWCEFDLGFALSAVLCPLFGFSFPFGLCLSGLVVLSVWCFCWCVCWCFSVCVALLFVWLGPFVCVLFFGCCRLPSLPDVASLPPAVGPVWRPGPVCTLVPPSGYLVASVTAWLPCFTAGSVVVLCRPYFILSHGSKGFWPCVGFLSPSPPCCMCC